MVSVSKPRNPLIADTCFKAGYIDSWGRGTIKIIEACKEAGLPDPLLVEEQGGFLSKIVKAKQELSTNEDGDENKIIQLRKKYGRSTKEVQKKLSFGCLHTLILL